MKPGKGIRIPLSNAAAIMRPVIDLMDDHEKLKAKLATKPDDDDSKYGKKWLIHKFQTIGGEEMRVYLTENTKGDRHGIDLRGWYDDGD